MPLQISGVAYYTTGEVIKALEISRQTLWRWRSEGSVPAGRRFRNKQVLFTESEFQAIEGFANRIEPMSGPSPQLRLSDGNHTGRP